MLIDWARPGKFGVEESDFRLCEAADFDASKFLAGQWMMFQDRHPMCLSEDNDIIL